MTKDSHIKLARSFASNLEEVDGIESASVDDWGRTKNFQACIVLEGDSSRVDADLRRITPRIKNIAEEDSHIWLERIDHPEYVRPSNYSEKSTRRDGRVSMVHYRIIP